MNITIRDFLQGQDVQPTNILWKRVFGVPKGNQTLEWTFRHGPAGNPPRVVAEVDGKIVAHAGGIPLRFSVGGDEVLGAYSVAAMTAPEMRKKRLYYRVGTYFYKRLEEKGYAFVAGFSNEKSYRLITGPLRRTALRPFPWCIRILRPFALLRGLLGLNVSIVPSGKHPVETRAGDILILEGSFGDRRIDKLWNAARNDIHISAIRDAAFNEWRFANRPDAGYRIFFAVRDHELVGYCVLRMLVIRGIPACFLMDILLDPKEPEAGYVLVKSCIRSARSMGAVLMSALLPQRGIVHRVLRKSRFRRVPERLHPQMIRFSVRGLGKYTNHPELTNPKSWLLTWADTDIV